MSNGTDSRQFQLSWEPGRPAWSAFGARVSLVVLQYLPSTVVISSENQCYRQCQQILNVAIGEFGEFGEREKRRVQSLSVAAKGAFD